MPGEARRLATLSVGWALLADVVPLYEVYVLLFAGSGLSERQISALFVLWSAVAVVAEVPTGALADRFSRRGALAVGGVAQAAGYLLWISVPVFWSFAAGFVLWSLGGSLTSGALEALLYDGLAAHGAEQHFPLVYGWVSAVGQLALLPASAAATLLYAAGGFALVGWVSIAGCLGAAALATRLPEHRNVEQDDGDDGDDGDPTGYLATLGAGVRLAAFRPALRTALLVAAVLGGVDAVEEYFPLLAAGWGVPVVWVPIATLVIPLAGAAGAALGGPASRLPTGTLATVLAAASAVLALAAALGGQVAIAGVAVFYGGYRLALVVVAARLQERIDSSARATVTSVAELGTELAAIGVFAAWSFGGLTMIAAVTGLVALWLPYLLRSRR